jgi:sugar fermentation stimulation protein A
MQMKIPGLLRGNFQERPNRFTVIFNSHGKTEKAHLRDPGRLKELLNSGVSLLLRPAQNQRNRKTRYDVMAVWKNDKWVVINSGLHSDLAAALIETDLIPEFSNFQVQKREYTYGKSRLDFLLSTKDSTPSLEDKMLLEVKGCTLVEDGLAMVPDAPTTRGKRHGEELIHAKEEGLDAAILFLILREDPVKFTPNWNTDPDFSQALTRAYDEGVKIIAYSFKNSLNKNSLDVSPFRRVEVKI